MTYKDFNKEPDENKISRINAAGIINITLENLWRDSSSAMCRGDLNTCNIILDSIWVILGGDEDEDSDKSKEFNELDLKIHETGNLKQKTIGFELQKSDKRPMQYLLLRNKALFLRRLQNVQGKGTAYNYDDQDDFD